MILPGREGPIADVQFRLALAGNRTHFADGVARVLQDRASFIEKRAAGLGEAPRFGGTFDNCTPISSSRSRICRLSDGCETCNRCIAARETFSISATATK